MTSSETIPDLVSFGSESDIYTIEIRPTTKCNYNCYYCEDLHNNKNPNLQLDADSVVALIQSAKAHLHKPVKIYLYGGEPTMYSGLLDLINILSNACDDNDLIEIQSNFSRPQKWFENICEQIENKRRVRFSGSYHNTQTSITKFLRVCMYLKHTWFLNMVTFMYNRRKSVIKDFELARRLLGEKHCELSPLISSTIDQNPALNNNTHTEIDYIYEHEDCEKFYKHSFMFDNMIPYETIEGEKHTSRAMMWKLRNYNFKGMKCSIKKDKIYIDWDGSAYKCINDLLGSQSSQFNVNDSPDYDEYFSTVTCFECPHTRCFFDMEYEKHPNK